MHVEPKIFIFIVLQSMFIVFSWKSIRQLLDLVFGFFHLKCIIKQLLDSVFVICKIINVSVRVISLAFGSDDNSYLDIDIRSASQKPHPIVVYYIPKNPGRVSHAVRPGLNDAVKFILCIGENFRHKHCPNFASFELFVN